MSLDKFFLIDSTLREGEQSKNVSFTIDQSIEIARKLEQFGVEYIEVTSPCVSEYAFTRVKKLVDLELKPKLATHIRCVKNDIATMLKTGIKAVNIYFNLYFYSQKYPNDYGFKNIINYIRNHLKMIRESDPEIEIRFSFERTFEQEPVFLESLYRELLENGLIDRIGISDTLGIILPEQVEQMTRNLRSFYSGPIEGHFHNDTECGVINAYTALKNGATHIQTSVLGLGERNGITSLSGLIARVYSLGPEGIKKKYRLSVLKQLVELVSLYSGHPVPENHCVTGNKAFSHKSAPHIYSMMSGLQDYEPFKPTEFEIQRKINVAHKLTSWKILKIYAANLGIHLSDIKLKKLTRKFKNFTEHKECSIDRLNQFITESIS